MKAKRKTVSIPTNTVEKNQTIKSLISSFRIENIHISESEAGLIYKKVETRIKKLAL